MYDFTRFPVLETERLLLREITPEDTPALFKFRGDAEAEYYNGGGLADPDGAAKLIEEMAQGYRDRTTIEWGVTLKGCDEVLGIMGYANWHHPTRQAEIGYDLRRDHWRRGITTEALRPILAFGFDSMDLNRIHACPWTENVASCRVLEKLGFQLEGVRRDEYWKDGAFHDESNYSLLLREYRPMEKR